MQLLYVGFAFQSLYISEKLYKVIVLQLLCLWMKS